MAAVHKGTPRSVEFVLTGELRKTEEGRIRLKAAATRVGDVFVVCAAKRVRFASDQVDGGAGVSTDHATGSQSASTSPTLPSETASST